MPQKNGGWRQALRVMGWILIGYAGVMFIATVPVALLGGPVEPPSNMSYDEFSKWKAGGAWLNESMGFIIGSFAIGCLLLIIGRKEEMSHPAI